MSKTYQDSVQLILAIKYLRLNASNERIDLDGGYVNDVRYTTFCIFDKHVKGAAAEVFAWEFL